MPRGRGAAAGQAAGVGIRAVPRVRRLCVAFVLLASLSAAAQAQRIVGTVLRPDSLTPAARILVEWRTPSTDLRRTSTDDLGRFTIQLDLPDTVQLRLLRPGFRPQALAPVVVAADSTVPLRAVLHGEVVRLGAMRVEEHPVCGPRGESIAWTLWEQARVAMQSAVLAERDPSLHIEAVEYAADVLLNDSVVVFDSTVTPVPPARVLPQAHYDSLFRFGYVRRVADTTTYFAPTLATIADERFAGRYCFQRVSDEERHPDWIGVAFEPQRSPGPGISDVVGTFWLDRATLLLQRVEFEYVNLPAHHRIRGLGGELRFGQLASGHALLLDWVVRLPLLDARRPLDGPAGRVARGGAVLLVERQGQRLHEHARAAAFRAAAARAP